MPPTIFDLLDLSPDAKSQEIDGEVAERLKRWSGAGGPTGLETKLRLARLKELVEAIKDPQILDEQRSEFRVAAKARSE